jgi:thiamine-monophosphate kinase
MSGPDDEGGPVDEFDWIARGLRPLTEGAPEALGLLDDAAVIPSRPGYDLIVSKDAVVEGVHFLPDDPLDLVARKLLRTNLSDLAAKGAEPYGYFLAVAWPPGYGWARRKAFAAGLRADQDEFRLQLFGGDTVSTPGPLTASVTILGWTPAGQMIPRSGAQAGDVILVTGTIGDGWLGLAAAQRRDLGLSAADHAWLADRYRLPRPRCGFGEALRACAHAAADVSDGLIADAERMARTSGLRLTIELEQIPLSTAAATWLARQHEPTRARIALASGGDDYEVICTAPPGAAAALQAAAEALGFPMTQIGVVTMGGGVRGVSGGRPLSLAGGGWRHPG